MPLTGAQWAASIPAQGVLNIGMVSSYAAQLISDLAQYAQAATLAGRVVGTPFLLACVEAEHVASWFESGNWQTIVPAISRNLLITRGTAAYNLAATI